MLTSDQVLDMDVTELGDLATETCELVYLLTSEEVQALAWLGDRYSISELLLDHTEEQEDGSVILRVDPFDVSDALDADGVDRVPCLSEDTALARFIWVIGPV